MGYQGLDCPRDVEFYAEWGRLLDLEPTMTPEEGRTRYEQARRKWIDTPRFGHCCPCKETAGPAWGDLSAAFGRLHEVMKAITPGRCSYPPGTHAEMRASKSKTEPLADAPEARTPEVPAPRQKQRRKGDARVLLSATLESLVEKGQWGKTNREIYHLATIAKDSFYRLIKNDARINQKMDEYRRRSLGKGPARADDL